MEALGINLGYLLVQIVNFAVLVVVLRVWVYKPLLAMLEKRRETIALGLEDARVAGEARSHAEEEAKKILAEAQKKGNDIMRAATERTEAIAREIKSAAEADAAKAREAVAEEAISERDRMLADMRGQIASLAIAAAQKLIGESLDEKRQHALIDDFFSGIKGGKVLVLEDESLTGASAEVTSAVPLNDAEQSTIKKDVLAKVGDQATVTFRVDPSILGGLVLRVGDKVLDSSVAGQLEGLRQSLS